MLHFHCQSLICPKVTHSADEIHESPDDFRIVLTGPTALAVQHVKPAA